VEPIRRLKAIAARRATRMVPGHDRGLAGADRAARRPFGRARGQGRCGRRRRGCSHTMVCRRPPAGAQLVVGGSRTRRCRPRLAIPLAPGGRLRGAAAARPPSRRLAGRMCLRRPAMLRSIMVSTCSRTPGRKRRRRTRRPSAWCAAVHRHHPVSAAAGRPSSLCCFRPATGTQGPPRLGGHVQLGDDLGQPGPDQLALVLEVDVEWTGTPRPG